MFRKAETARTTDLNFSSAWLSGSLKSESRSVLHPGADRFNSNREGPRSGGFAHGTPNTASTPGDR